MSNKEASSLPRAGQSLPLGMRDTLAPLGSRDVRGWLMFAAIGVLIVLLSLLSPVLSPRWAGRVFLVCFVAFMVRGLFVPRTAPATRERKGARAAFIAHAALVVGFGVGFVIWGRALGLAWPVVIAALLFIEALPNMVISLSEWWRLSGVGLSIGCLVVGVGLPIVPQEWLGLYIGSAVAATSLLSAGILHWQVRRHENLSAGT